MSSTAAPPSASPSVTPPPPPHDDEDDGVDVSLIRWTLSLTPSERLAVAQGFVDSVHAVVHGARNGRTR
jgi:hypothetical protein